MLLRFYKMNSAGNDFIIIDNRDLSTSLDEDTIAALCDRHRGIGADGLLAVETPEKGADFKLRHYDAEGTESAISVNGARCFAFFTAHLGDAEALPTTLTFETTAGIITANLLGDDIRIGAPEPKNPQLNLPIQIEGFNSPLHSIETEDPCFVSFVENLENVDILTHGRALCAHPHFHPEIANASFAQVLALDHLAIRSYERDAEKETLACGSGTIAAALLHHLITGAESPIKVDVEGGDTLLVSFGKTDRTSFTNVALTGPADFVFEGEIAI